jgi:hypothetical protein
MAETSQAEPDCDGAMSELATRAASSDRSMWLEPAKKRLRGKARALTLIPMYATYTHLHTFETAMKRAALSVRIAETTKKAIDKAAAKDHRSTASLVELILTDHLARMSGLPAKYPNPDEWLAAGRKLLDLPVPNGKLLGDCTGAECKAIGRAYEQVSKTMLALARQRR